MPLLSTQISTNDEQINGIIQIFKYESGGATIYPALSKKSFCISESSKAQIM